MLFRSQAPLKGHLMPLKPKICPNHVKKSMNMTSNTLWHIFMNFMGEDTPTSSADSDGTTSVHEDPPEPEDQPLLTHMTKKKPLPPGNVRLLLSTNANNKPAKSDQLQEVNLNGILYCQVNMASTIYNISSCNAEGTKASLVDCGANGGIAGDDVRVIAMTNRSVDI